MTLADPPMTEEELPPPAPRRRSRLTPLGKLVIVMLVILMPLGALAGYVAKESGGASSGSEVTVVIPRGASASAIADQLADAGVIDSAWMFRLYARIKGGAESLKPGEYVLRMSMPYGEIMTALSKGPKLEFIRVTIPEGKTLQETARIFERLAGIPAADFLAETQTGRHSTAILPSGTTNLEGILFPKTYDLRPNPTAAAAVGLLIDQFEKDTADVDWNKAKSLGVTPYQALVIASMIEREARVPQDRAKVSRVIYNRLARKMRLQIDATVQYGIFLKTGSYKNPLLTSDYEFSSPYNTYLIDGVPPAPIASPGLASIEAALNPAEGAWLYYVLINDKGEHAFANTYDEFVRLKNSR